MKANYDMDRSFTGGSVMSHPVARTLDVGFIFGKILAWCTLLDTFVIIFRYLCAEEILTNFCMTGGIIVFLSKVGTTQQ